MSACQIVSRVSGHVCVGMSVWARVFGHICVGMSVWACLSGHGCLGMSSGKSTSREEFELQPYGVNERGEVCSVECVDR